MRVPVMIALVAAGLTLAACSGNATPARQPPILTTTAPHHQVAADEKTDGQTVTLAVGDQLEVTLHSTYWGFGTPGTELRMTGQHSTAVPVGTGPGHCVAGEGCGTETRVYTATSAGTTAVTATRKSCGEAMRCTGANGVYRITVIVH